MPSLCTRYYMIQSLHYLCMVVANHACTFSTVLSFDYRNTTSTLLTGTTPCRIHSMILARLTGFYTNLHVVKFDQYNNMQWLSVVVLLFVTMWAVSSLASFSKTSDTSTVVTLAVWHHMTLAVWSHMQLSVHHVNHQFLLSCKSCTMRLG